MRTWPGSASAEGDVAPRSELPPGGAPPRLPDSARVAITGAGGFVGGRLLGRLLERDGPTVLALARRSTARLQRLRGHDRHRLALFDLRHEGALQAAFDDFAPTHVVHLAALANPRANESDPALARELNVELCSSVAEAALAVGAKLLFASTAQVYGPSPNPIPETAPLEPRGVYGRTKLEAERRLAEAVQRGLTAVIARPFNHAGPGQSEDYALAAFAARLARGRGDSGRLPVGNLSAARDFLHVDDVLSAYELLLLRGQNGRAYNVCRGSAVTLGELWSGLARRFGYSPGELAQRTFAEPFLVRPGEPDEVFGDVSRLSALGFSPAFSIDSLLDDLAAPLL